MKKIHKVKIMKKQDLKVGVNYDIVDPACRRYQFNGYTYKGIKTKGPEFLNEHISFAKEGKEDLHIMSACLGTLEITESAN